MKKIITEKEAYTLYLEYGWEDVLPFKSLGETDFINWLEGLDWEIVKEGSSEREEG